MKDQDRINKEIEFSKEDDLDLLSLVKTLWERQRTIIISIIIFALFGLFVALFSKKEFNAHPWVTSESQVIVPEKPPRENKLSPQELVSYKPCSNINCLGV